MDHGQELCVAGFGDSFSSDAKVIDLIKRKMRCSISLGLWSTLDHAPGVDPLGSTSLLRQRHGHFRRLDQFGDHRRLRDPAFLFAILLIVVFGRRQDHLDWFPLRGLTPSNFDELEHERKISTTSATTLPVNAKVQSATSRP